MIRSLSFVYCIVSKESFLLSRYQELKSHINCFIYGFLRYFIDKNYKCTQCYVEGKGGKNRRRGKGDGEESKRELEFKEDGE